MPQQYTQIFSGLEARSFLRKHNYKPSNLHAQISFELIEGLSEASISARNKSFLTHSTHLEDQIRFPLQDRVDRSFKSLAADFLNQKINITQKKISLDFHDTVSINLFESLGLRISKKNRSSSVSGLKKEILNQDERDLLEYLKNPQRNYDQILFFVRKKIYSCDYRTALNILNTFKDLDCKKTDFYYFKGLCHNYFGQTDLSQINFERIYQLGTTGGKVNACYVLSMLYLRLHPVDRQNLQKAETYLEEAYQLLQGQPQTENIIFQRVFNRNGYALCLYRRGLIDTAVEVLENGLQTLRALQYTAYHLHYSVLLYNALQCYRSLQKFSDCERVTTELLALDPLFPEYYLEHGKTQLEQGRTAKAREYFKHAKLLDPFIPESYALIAYSYFIENNFKKAIKNYKLAINLKPEAVQFQDDILYCQHQLDRSSDAEVCL